MEAGSLRIKGRRFIRAPRRGDGAVRSIAVTLVVGPVLAERAQARGSATSLSTRIRLRNR